MTHGRTRPAPRARPAIAAIFMINGTLFGNWVSRIPTIKDQLDLGTGPLGAALLGIALGAMLSRPLAGQLAARHGSGPITRIGITLCCALLPLPALATGPVTLGLALTALGAALGVSEVAMNAHAVTVQGHLGRPIMSSFHGVYSVGGLLGVLAGGRAAAYGLDPRTHFAAVAVVLAVVALVASTRLLPPRVDVAPRAGRGGWVRVPRQHRLTLVGLGFVGLCTMVGEGAVGDWGAVYLHEDLGTGVGFASFGFAAYSTAMVSGRLVGDRLIARWGELRVVTWLAATGGVGLAVALAVGHPVGAICGFAVLGVGLSLVVPVVFSMTGRLGEVTAGPSVTVVSSICGTGFLAGPPVIGFLAEAVGLPAALGVVSLLALTAAGLVRVVGRRIPSTTAVPAAVTY
jgi:MFS family permease